MSIINSITGKTVKDPIVARMLERCQKAIDEAKNSPPPPLTEEEKQEYFRKAAEEAKEYRKSHPTHSSGLGVPI